MSQGQVQAIPWPTGRTWNVLVVTSFSDESNTDMHYILDTNTNANKCLTTVDMGYLGRICRTELGV